MDLSKIYVASTTFQTMECPLIEFDQQIIGDMDKLQKLMARAMLDHGNQYMYNEQNAIDSLFDNVSEEDAEILGLDEQDNIEFSVLLEKAKEGNVSAITAILNGHTTLYPNQVYISTLDTML